MDNDWFKKLFINDVKSVLGQREELGITEIQSSAAMDGILEDATDDDVGKAYLYVGETDEKYEHNAVYIIKEN